MPLIYDDDFVEPEAAKTINYAAIEELGHHCNTAITQNGNALDA